MLEVLVVSRWFPTPAEPLAGIFVRDWIKAVEGEVRTTVIVPRDAPILRALTFLVARSKFDEAVVVVPVARVPVLGVMARWLALERAIARLVSRPDIVHVHLLLPDAFPASLVARRRRLPLVVTEHADFVRDLRRSLRGRLQLGWVLRRANIVTAVSPRLAAELREYESSARLTVIPNPVDVDAFSPGGSRGDFAVSVAVSPGTAKGTDVLLRAWARAREEGAMPRLVVVGDGPELAGLRELARELGIEDLSEFVGHVEESRLVQLMREARFLVSASRSETFGRTVVEALAVGTPVVATRTGVAEEALARGGGVLVPPGDVEALAAAVIRMTVEAGSYDPALLHELAARRYGYDAVGPEIATLYRSLTGAPT